MNLIEKSQQIHRDAEELLESTKVLEYLLNFGDVRIGGSYFTDLMYGPDIDITVATDTPRKSAVDFMNFVIDKKLFARYECGDFENFPREKRPKDYIIVLQIPHRHQKWEIEIWFTKNHYIEQIELEEKLCALTGEDKRKILQIKENRSKSGIDKHSLSSFEIYKSYLSDN